MSSLTEQFEEDWELVDHVPFICTAEDSSSTDTGLTEATPAPEPTLSEWLFEKACVITWNEFVARGEAKQRRLDALSDKTQRHFAQS